MVWLGWFCDSEAFLVADGLRQHPILPREEFTSVWRTVAVAPWLRNGPGGDWRRRWQWQLLPAYGLVYLVWYLLLLGFGLVWLPPYGLVYFSGFLAGCSLGFHSKLVESRAIIWLVWWAQRFVKGCRRLFMVIWSLLDELWWTMTKHYFLALVSCMDISWWWSYEQQESQFYKHLQYSYLNNIMA